MLTLLKLGGAWIAGRRDTARDVTGLSGRFVRAHRNLLEIIPQFVAALPIVHAAQRADALTVIGAWTFVVARILYVPAYAFARSAPPLLDGGASRYFHNLDGPLLVRPWLGSRLFQPC